MIRRQIPVPPKDEQHPWGAGATPYESLGGADPVRAVVEEFYDVIEEQSPVLRAMLPKDTSGSRQKLREYLSEWLGGPPLYSEKRGHPRLRMRHLPFPIGSGEAEEWMRCMRLALDRQEVAGAIREFLEAKLEPLALHMVNR